MTDSDCAIMNAETHNAESNVEQNLHASVADHAIEHSPKMFPRSKKSAKYGYGRS